MSGSTQRPGMPSDMVCLLRAPLWFEVAGQQVHSPLVQVRIQGVNSLMIVDTGASDHLLTRELADTAGLQTVATEPGTDHAGASVPSWSLGEMELEMGGVPLSLKNVIAIEGPPAFQACGIGGFLSPQHLHPNAHLLLDFYHQELSLLQAPLPVLNNWLSARLQSLLPVYLRRKAGAVVTVEAAIEPFSPVDTMLNSGGICTEFAEMAVPGLQGLMPERFGKGISGADVTGLEVSQQILSAGQARLEVPLLLVRKQMPPPPGQIGMDLLQQTALLISPDKKQAVQWWLPAKKHRA